MATSTQSVQFSNIAATTSGFMLKGGGYLIIATGTITTVQLQTLSVDGSTWVANRACCD